MDAKYRACVIGWTGRGDYGHMLEWAFTDLPSVRIVAVSDANAEAGREVATRIGAPSVYTDYEQMLSSETPDLVAIGPRWPDARCEMVTACAQAGVRGILCEKPFAASLDAADQMVGACQAAGTRLQLAHQLRVTGQIAKARRLVAEGQIGQVTSLRGRGKEDSRGGGEDLAVLGVHILNLMRWFGGDARWAFARVAVDGRDAVWSDVREATEPIGPVCGNDIAAWWGMGDGAIGSFESRRDQPNHRGRMGLQIWGSEGVIDITNSGDRPVHISRRPLTGPWETDWEPVIDEDWLGTPAEQRFARDNRALATDLIQAIEDDREPVCGAEDARAVTEMIVAAYAAHIGGMRVELPLPGGVHPLLQWSGGMDADPCTEEDG